MKTARLRLRPPGGSFPGVDAAFAAVDGIEREQLAHFEWLTNGTYLLLYRLRAEPGADVTETLAAHDAVIDYDVADADDRDRYCYVHVEEHEFLSELLETADEHALVLERPIRFVEEGAILTVVGDSEAIQAAFSEAIDTIDIRVEWSGGYDPGETGAMARLTSRQREAARTAYELGFYENPRETSYEEIADALGCAPSTANELLRRAEAAVMATALEG